MFISYQLSGIDHRKAEKGEWEGGRDSEGSGRNRERKLRERRTKGEKEKGV